MTQKVPTEDTETWSTPLVIHITAAGESMGEGSNKCRPLSTPHVLGLGLSGASRVRGKLLLANRRELETYGPYKVIFQQESGSFGPYRIQYEIKLNRYI